MQLSCEIMHGIQETKKRVKETLKLVRWLSSSSSSSNNNMFNSSSKPMKFGPAGVGPRGRREEGGGPALRLIVSLAST